MYWKLFFLRLYYLMSNTECVDPAFSTKIWIDAYIICRMRLKVLLVTFALVTTCEAVLPSRQCGWERPNVTEEVISMMQNRQPSIKEDVVVWRKGEGVLHDNRIRRNF
ncbi:unnamed protein product [Cylicocyclus nassatus]|uniref:Uncharacterized protein n=1 Tax=Cylicocyclus nassatus TaxID=53992 RepID=A0AA36DNM2_CYLNA|nr:unnamed protein product [Cylicocyclus nassatus]